MPLEDTGESVQIERADVSRGFEPGNLTLRQKAKTARTPHVRREEPAVDVNKLSEWLTKRAQRLVELTFGKYEPTPLVTADDVLMIYARQGGRCAVSGLTFVLDKALHPESMALTWLDPLSPQTAKNSVLVALSIKPFIDKWGAQYLRRVAKRIVKHKKQPKSKET